MRHHYYSKKLDNLDETEKLPEIHKQPKLFQEDTYKLKRPITSKRLEETRPRCFIGECHHFLKIQTNYSQTPPKIRIFVINSIKTVYPDVKTRQRYHKKEKNLGKNTNTWRLNGMLLNSG